MRLMIVDDSNMIRARITRLAQAGVIGPVEVVAQASTGVEALRLAVRHRPDLVTMDLTMPEMDGVECIGKLVQLMPNINILVVSALTDKATAIAALRLGGTRFSQQTVFRRRPPTGPARHPGRFDMNTLTEEDLKLFVDSVRNYFKVTTGQEPKITSAFLATGDVEGYEFNGIVSFSGSYNGQVMVSMPSQLLRELLVLQGETDLSDPHLLDAVGEVANTLAGNARRTFGPSLGISVPIKLMGATGITARVRQRPYAITLRWGHLPAMVCVDLEARV